MYKGAVPQYRSEQMWTLVIAGVLEDATEAVQEARQELESATT